MSHDATNPPVRALPRRHFLARMVAAVAGMSVFRRAAPAEAATLEVTPYIGEIILVSFNFPPKGWAFCNGQLLAINQNQALFSILGTTYGGNGTTNFALPNLQGRVAIHKGQGHVLGEVGGEAAHTLSLAELPAHTHGARAASAVATAVAPSGTLVPAKNPAQIPEWGATANAVMGSDAISATGSSQAHPNEQPYFVLNYIISLSGVFPSQT